MMADTMGEHHASSNEMASVDSGRRLRPKRPRQNEHDDVSGDTFKSNRSTRAKMTSEIDAVTEKTQLPSAGERSRRPRKQRSASNLAPAFSASDARVVVGTLAGHSTEVSTQSLSADSCNLASSAVVHSGRKLATTLSSTAARRWMKFEFLYSGIDRGFFLRNEFVECLADQGLSDARRLTRTEWSALRARLGKPRVLSARFLEQERAKLERYRIDVRRVQLSLLPRMSSVDGPFVYQVCEPYGIGQRVTIVHPIHGHLCTGHVTGCDVRAGVYRVQCDRHGDGIARVPDTEVYPHGVLPLLYPAITAIPISGPAGAAQPSAASSSSGASHQLSRDGSQSSDQQHLLPPAQTSFVPPDPWRLGNDPGPNLTYCLAANVPFEAIADGGPASTPSSTLPTRPGVCRLDPSAPHQLPSIGQPVRIAFSDEADLVLRAFAPVVPVEGRHDAHPARAAVAAGGAAAVTAAAPQAAAGAVLDVQRQSVEMADGNIASVRPSGGSRGGDAMDEREGADGDADEHTLGTGATTTDGAVEAQAAALAPPSSPPALSLSFSVPPADHLTYEAAAAVHLLPMHHSVISSEAAVSWAFAAHAASVLATARADELQAQATLQRLLSRKGALLKSLRARGEAAGVVAPVPSGTAAPSGTVAAAAKGRADRAKDRATLATMVPAAASPTGAATTSQAQLLANDCSVQWLVSALRSTDASIDTQLKAMRRLAGVQARASAWAGTALEAAGLIESDASAVDSSPSPLAGAPGSPRAPVSRPRPLVAADKQLQQQQQAGRLYSPAEQAFLPAALALGAALASDGSAAGIANRVVHSSDGGGDVEVSSVLQWALATGNSMTADAIRSVMLAEAHIPAAAAAAAANYVDAIAGDSRPLSQAGREDAGHVAATVTSCPQVQVVASAVQLLAALQASCDASTTRLGGMTSTQSYVAVQRALATLANKHPGNAGLYGDLRAAVAVLRSAAEAPLPPSWAPSR